jgi:hypothetical protein
MVDARQSGATCTDATCTCYTLRLPALTRANEREEEEGGEGELADRPAAN